MLYKIENIKTEGNSMHFYSLTNENIESISMGVGEIDLDNDKTMLQTKNEVFTYTNKDEHFNIKLISE